MNLLFYIIDIKHKSAIFEECVQLRNYLNSRHVPMEENETREKFETIQQNLLSNKKVADLPDIKIQALAKKYRPKALKILKQQTSMWKPINYDTHKSLLYMTARSSQDYAVLYSIFNEIRIRDKKFKPETVLDFGSGIGTSMWQVLRNIIKHG